MKTAAEIVAAVGELNRVELHQLRDAIDRLDKEGRAIVLRF